MDPLTPGTCMYRDRFGRIWNLPINELCQICFQPDSYEDCDHQPLTDEQARSLGASMATAKKPKRLIKWINLAKGEGPDNAGHWRSVEGRFYISPRYRSTVYPDSYLIMDNATKIMGSSEHCVFETVRDAKDWAEEKIRKSLEIDGVDV